MTISEVLLLDFDLEMAGTRRTLERIPGDKPEYKPHEKSMAMGRLAMHVATLPRFGATILTTPEMNMANPDHKWPDMTFVSRDKLLDTFDENAAEARAALAASADQDLTANWKFSFGDHVISNGPRSVAYRVMFFNHLLHHRAQLGVYLRMNDVPVPGIYGPSADEPFPAKK
jgi:uncharacterized damage-inducible protein DinB